eukprot:TRINITY_DN3401_c0_g1_i2.p1 TRINITY_DN3401_c0_g1~~TRINITY_DN3401_c0_g1_i2.p1  ORF type:complete len:255 (-),score=52.38 TRINITY_DN3401_c0_g1_i2:263-1027(-)
MCIRDSIYMNQVIDFTKFSIQTTLLYDTPDNKERSVLLHKSKALESKVIQETPGSASFECKIRALSSQHESMLFKIKFSALDPTTGGEYNPPIHAYSDPIRVISKPEQIKKRKAGAPVPPVAPKKSKTDEVFATLVGSLTVLQRDQDLLQKLIDPLLVSKTPAPRTPHLRKKFKEEPIDFEIAFQNFHNSFSLLPEEQRSTETHNLSHILKPQEKLLMNELLGLFMSETSYDEASESFPADDLLNEFLLNVNAY